MKNILNSIKSLLLNSNSIIFLTSLIAVGAIALWYFPQKSQLLLTPNNSKNMNSQNNKLKEKKNIIDQSPYPQVIEEKKNIIDQSPYPQVIEEKVKSINNLDSQKNLSETSLQNDDNPPEVQNFLHEKENINIKNTRYGHFPFAEESKNELMNMGKYYNRTEYLNKEAGIAFQKMRQDAQSQGIQLVLISGFRSITSQQELFQKQVEKRGGEKVAAKLSAPPGYSEHHTGYAVDIGDGTKPELDLKYDFESTQAYKWLKSNARNYGFELSFPPNNIQGVSFEPWHWRYVASEKANSIFAQTQSLQ